MLFVLARASGGAGESLRSCNEQLEFGCSDGPARCEDGSDEQSCGERGSRDRTSSPQRKLSPLTAQTFFRETRDPQKPRSVSMVEFSVLLQLLHIVERVNTVADLSISNPIKALGLM